MFCPNCGSQNPNTRHNLLGLRDAVRQSLSVEHGERRTAGSEPVCANLFRSRDSHNALLLPRRVRVWHRRDGVRHQSDELFDGRRLGRRAAGVGFG